MLRSSSKSSLCSPPFKKNQTHILLAQIQSTLQQTSKVMSFQYFQNFFQTLIKRLIFKAEIQKNQPLYLAKLKNIMKIYKPSLQIVVRILLLQIKCEIESNPSSQTLQKLTKAKHLVLDTDCEYILAKIFILQAKYNQCQNDINLVYKYYKKCIDFTETYVVQYLKQSQEIRKQIAQCMIISLYEMFQIKKQVSPKQAQQLLMKAFKACQKNYGYENNLTLQIKQMYNQQKTYKNSFDKVSQSSYPNKAITQILDYQMKKSMRIHGFYSWQDEKLIVQLLKIKKEEKKVTAQASYAIKLDMIAINKLRNIQWVQLINGDLIILQQDIAKEVGSLFQSPNNKQNTAATRIGMRNISRQQIIKKSEYSSSSQDDPSLFQNGDFNIMKVLTKTSTRGRSQSAHKKNNY